MLGECPVYKALEIISQSGGEGGGGGGGGVSRIF